jgi:hypothetical protein
VSSSPPWFERPLCRASIPVWAAVHPIRWSKEFLEAGKKRLLGDTAREATAPEVKALRDENGRLKQVLAETVLENRLLKKSVTGPDSGDDTCG